MRVVQYRRRTPDCLMKFLNQLTAGVVGSLPSGTLIQLMTTRPLWRLLLEAADADIDYLEPTVRALLTRVMSEGVVRMRGMAKSLARDLLELPYFSNTGLLARSIKELVEER